MKLRIKARAALPLLVCALVLFACAFGLRGVWQERQRQTAVLRERQDTAEKLGDALALLRESRGRYLAAAQRVRDEKNDYETQKDLVSIAKDALDKRRAALAKAAASGSLSGDELTQARGELDTLLTDFSAREQSLAGYEALADFVGAYETQKTHARELLSRLREDALIREKLDAGAGPIAAAGAALKAEAASLRRRFYISVTLFAALGTAAVLVLARLLRQYRKR